MVSFNCNNCQDVVKKPKVRSHAGMCGSSHFTCVDCMQVFDLNTIQGHTNCITEVDKYAGKWLDKAKKNNNNGEKKKKDPTPFTNPYATSSDDDEDLPVKKAPKKEGKKEAKKSVTPKASPKASPKLKPQSPPLKAKKAASASAARDEVMIESFSLGTSCSVRELVEDIVAENQTIKSKDLGKQVAEAYAKKIGKALVPAIEKAMKGSKKVKTADGVFKAK